MSFQELPQSLNCHLHSPNLWCADDSQMMNYIGLQISKACAAKHWQIIHLFPEEKMNYMFDQWCKLTVYSSTAKLYFTAHEYFIILHTLLTPLLYI